MPRTDEACDRIEEFYVNLPDTARLINGIKETIGTICDESDDGNPMYEILELAEENGMEQEKAHDEIDSLRGRGGLIEPEKDHFRLVYVSSKSVRSSYASDSESVFGWRVVVIGSKSDSSCDPGGSDTTISSSLLVHFGLVIEPYGW